MIAEVAAALERVLPGRVERDVPAAILTTYRVGGPLAVLVRVRSAGEARRLAGVLSERRPPLLVVGRGSNLLVADEGFAGVAILPEGPLEDVEVDAAAARVRAGGAAALPVVARRAAAAGVGGLEFYVGIPGSLGGAVRMNAGGHGRETREVLVEAVTVDLLSGRERRRDPDQLGLGYRTSTVGDQELVVEGYLVGVPEDPVRCEARLAEIVRWRREHQPGGANAGSVFRNPPGDSAGRIIDACGLKGLRVGGATVSTKHANFFQADPGTRACDVLGLVREVQRRVAAETGVVLQPELRLVGFDGGGAP